MYALELVAETSAVLLAGAVIAGGLRRATAALRHQVWTLALAGAVVLPAASAIVPWEWNVLPSRAATNGVVPPSISRAVLEAEGAELSVIPVGSPEEWHQLDAAAPSRAVVGEQRTRPAVAAGEVLGGIWIAGALLVLGRLLVGVFWLNRVTARAVPIAHPAWRRTIQRVTGTVGLDRPVPVVLSDRIRTPLVHGFRRPVVVLPASSQEWTERQRFMVLLHEFAHVRRADIASLGIARLACTVYWFNPLVWVAARQMRVEMERACDDWVLRAGARASAYAGHLMRMAAALKGVAVPAALALPMAQRAGFEGRLRAILKPDQPRDTLERGHTIMSVTTGCSLVFLLAATAPARDEVPEPATALPMSPTLTVVAPAPDHPAPDVPRMTAVSASTASAGDALQVEEDPRSVAALSRTLRGDDDPAVRKMAAWALGQLRDRAAVAALAGALSTDADPDVRETAAWALGQIGDRTAVAALISAVGDRELSVRSTVVWALGQLEDRTAVEALGRALSDEDASIRKSAAWALGQIEDPLAVPVLSQAVQDQSESVRRQVVWALGQIESVDGAPALEAALQDADAGVRKDAAWALGQVESRGSVAGLSAAVRSDENADVRVTAAWALGQIEDVAAVPALSDAMGDANARVRRTAAWALGQIEPRTAPQGLIDALRDDDAEVVESVVWALAKIEDPAAVEGIRSLIDAEHPEVRRRAIWALSRLGDDIAMQAVAELLQDPDPEVRRAAAAALGGKWRHVSPRPRPQPRPQPRPRPRPYGGN